MLRRPVVLMVLALASTARADVPPPPDSPDAHCSLEEQCKAGVLCPYAFNPGHKLAPGEVPEGQACRSDALAKGLEQRCRHGSNYSGDELFCPKGAAGTWSPPPSAIPTATATAAPSATATTAPTALASAAPTATPSSAATPAPSTSAPADPGKGKSSCAAPAGDQPGSGAALVLAGAAVLLASLRRRRQATCLGGRP